MESYCRVCGKETQPKFRRNIFAETFQFYRELKHCIGAYDDTDGRSKWICSLCLNKLRRIRSLDNDVKERAHTLITIKHELVSSLRVKHSFVKLTKYPPPKIEEKRAIFVAPLKRMVFSDLHCLQQNIEYNYNGVTQFDYLGCISVNKILDKDADMNFMNFVSTFSELTVLRENIEVTDKELQKANKVNDK